MEKVKVTQDVANAIEFALNTERLAYYQKPDELLKSHMRSKNYLNELIALGEIDSISLAKSLYIGYEVEPEFKVGDWVTRIDGDSFYLKGNVKTVRILSVRHDKTLENDYAQHGENGSWGTPFINLRHATPSEIAEEKERRLFAKHGRKVGKFISGDILKLKNKVIEFWGYDQGAAEYLSDGIRYRTDILGFSNRCKLVCFTENRLDGDSDE